MRVEAFAPRWRRTWDRHVRDARNGHFFFERGYLEYHGDRFRDASLLFLRGDRLLLVLPAHTDGDALVSHGGLPFAGFIASLRCGHADVEDAFGLLHGWLRDHGLRRLVYKPVPWPYHAMVFEDDLYELHRRGARLSGMKLAAGFPGPESPCERSSTRRRRRRVEEGGGLAMHETGDLPRAWREVAGFLARRGYRPPVHTLEEMALVRGRFPQAVRLVVAERDGIWTAGKILLVSPRVTKLQYGFCTEAGEAWGRADRESLLHWIAGHPEFGRRWIDMGTSMDPGTGEMQGGVMAHKEQLGARGVAATTWEWTPP